MPSIVNGLMFLVLMIFALGEHTSKIVSYENEHYIKNYHFKYYTDYGIQREEIGKLKNNGKTEFLVVSGSYSYTGTDGKTYIVTYVADENGYRPKVLSEYPTAQFPSAALASLAGGGLG